MWFAMLPVLTFLTLASHDDVTKFWIRHPHAGCHWVYRQHGLWNWPVTRTNAVICWQDGQIQ